MQDTKQTADIIDVRQFQKKKTQVNIVPRNLAQENYLEMLKNPRKHIVFAIGPAGTGKTQIAVQMAVKQLKEGAVDKIIITRPTVSVDEDLGFLPGTLNQKMEPWVIPILDVFKEYYHPKDIQALLEDGTLEMAPLGMMRGRTFKRAFIVVDEFQNITHSQAKMVLTRIGDGSKMVITGDLEQADRPRENGLLDFVNRIESRGAMKMVDVAWFDIQDVERHPVVKEILSLYEETGEE